MTNTKLGINMVKNKSEISKKELEYTIGHSILSVISLIFGFFLWAYTLDSFQYWFLVKPFSMFDFSYYQSFSVLMILCILHSYNCKLNDSKTFDEADAKYRLRFNIAKSVTLPIFLLGFGWFVDKIAS